MKIKCFLLAAGLGLCEMQTRGQDSVTPLPARPPETSASVIASRQEAEENYNTLKGQIEDLQAANADLLKKTQEMRKEIDDLHEQLSKPQGNYASADDLKQLAAAVDDLNKKREADKQLILHEMEKLGHVVVNSASHTSDTPRTSVHHNQTAQNEDQTGYYYTVKKGDNFKIIAKNYCDQGIKVTSRQIIAANPNINPDKLYIGTKLFIPAPKSDVK